MRAVITEVAAETVADCTAQADPGHGVAYVAVATAAECAAAIECVPLGPVLEVRADLAGHLHRNATGARAGDLLDVRLARALHDVAHLQIAQASNRTIGVAIGVLMTTRRCSAEAAFELLRQASQLQNRKPRDIAAEVPYTGTIPDDTRRPAATGLRQPGGPYRPRPPS